MKKIIIILLVIFLTGCQANYDLKIDGDKVIENAKIQIEDTDENFSKVDKLAKELKIKKSEYKVVRDYSDINITYKKTYSSIEDYVLNSILYKQLFDEINLIKTNNKTILSTSADFKNDSISVSKDNLTNIDYLQINVSSSTKIISENSDTINQDNYTWIYNKKQLSKDISIAYLNKPSIFNFKSILISALLIISSVLMAVIIYRRFKERQKF